MNRQDAKDAKKSEGTSPIGSSPSGCEPGLPGVLGVLAVPFRDDRRGCPTILSTEREPELIFNPGAGNMADHVIALRSGRKLEVVEYGDRGGHPLLFFHGLIGSHHQASYVAEEAERAGLRIIAPNRPGVGRSEFIARSNALEAVDDIEDIASALGLDGFSVIGISGGTPYALGALHRLGERIQTVTIISGMGPMQLPGALQGMEQRRRLFLGARVSLPATGTSGVPDRRRPIPQRPGPIPPAPGHDLVGPGSRTV